MGAAGERSLELASERLGGGDIDLPGGRHDGNVSASLGSDAERAGRVAWLSGFH